MPLDRQSALARGVLVVLLLAGALVRLPHLADPPLGFHPTRQYRSAILARALAVKQLPAFSRAERTAVRRVALQLGPIEPPVFEHCAAALYRMAGREALWMPRLLGVLLWVAGGLALWWLTAPLFGGLAALVSVGIFLFLPYGVVASQAFQPDAPMTALVVASLAASFWRHRRPTVTASVVLLLVAAAAVFVKPMAAFFVVPVEAALAASRHGTLRGLRRAAAWSLAVAVPAIGWYVYLSMAAPAAFEDRFFPQLLLRPDFWRDWLRMAARVATWPVLLLGLAGVAASRGVTRRAMIALWLGYAALGLAFTHHIHTHDYYSLPLIPIVAWSVAALVARVAAAATPRARRPALAVTVVLVGVAVAAAWHGRPYAPDPAAAVEAARYERIGGLVGHSARVISLDGSYGFPLGYHGRLAAANLPLSIDRAVSTLAGRDAETPGALDALLAGDFFVATSRDEFYGWPALRDRIERQYPLVARDGPPEAWRFVVYDLRRTAISATPAKLSVFGRIDRGVWPVETVALWAAAGTAWRIVPSEPGRVLIAPDRGAGPATLSISIAPTSAELDRTLALDLFEEGQAVRSGSVALRVRTFQGPARPPFGHVDVPRDPVALAGDPVVFQGWALDDLCLARVWAGYRDASGRLVRLGDASRGGARPDVASAWPNAHDVLRSGWAFTLVPGALRTEPQPVTVRFFAEDCEGGNAELGSRTVRAR